MKKESILEEVRKYNELTVESYTGLMATKTIFEKIGYGVQDLEKNIDIIVGFHKGVKIGLQAIEKLNT